MSAARPEEIESFCRKHNLQAIPALPNLAGMETLIDESLMNQPQVFLDSGVSDGVLEIPQDQFKRMAEKAKVCEIAIPLGPLHQAHHDGCTEAKLTSAVEKFTTLRIKQRLEETLELPPLPDTAQKIIKLRVDPEADISDLANIVEMDPSLAAQVVSWASSPYYSAQGEIKSIHDAIVRVLGFDMVMNLSLGLALGKTLNMPNDSPRNSTPYWEQAVYTAALLEGLVTAQPREDRLGFGMAYLAGLLHNFGTLILAEVFPPYYSSICRHIEANPHVPSYMIEQHILGVSREQIAGWLMKLWNMPDEVVTALRHQHHPEYEGENSGYAKMLFVAQRLLQEHDIGQGSHLEIPNFIYRELHLNREKALATVENILASSDDLGEIANQLNS
ncbi:MAG: HDOD domain-containing protein [Candidatus Pelagadaptatus aseana]|uniref:aminoacyl-tRNA deacylase and HDOD domain-containing protein n=1 Tax=Candidatus Pelagadaptatus aseana TaxID=3120508 RepID=UPI0039B28330